MKDFNLANLASMSHCHTSKNYYHIKKKSYLKFKKVLPRV